MRDGRTVWYRGARYQLGQGPHYYAIWTADGPPSRPVEQWPQTPAGWSAAWARFTAVEQPGTIAHLTPPAAPPAAAPGRVTAAIALLVAGVIIGIAGLFPAYLSGNSLANQPDQLIPHVIYLAVWTASALLIGMGGVRRRAGMLLGLGTSIVTFGFFLADVGTVIAAGWHVLGAGLVLSMIGWLACTAGGAVAFRYHGEVRRSAGGLDRRDAGMVAVGVLAALGAAAAFAPSWDSYTLRTATGLTRILTAGNSFANPAPVIAGDVAVMVALVAVTVIAVLWRPARLGAVLLAGAVLPMVATAISALVQVGEPVTSSYFGIPPAQAEQLGLSIKSGVTPAFWIYCAFVVALALTCAGLLFPARPPWLARPAGRRPGTGRPGAGYPGASYPGASYPGSSYYPGGGQRGNGYPGSAHPAGGPPGGGYPGAAQPGTPQGTPQPGAAQPGTPQPGTPQPGTPQPGTPQPGTPQPGGTGQPTGEAATAAAPITGAASG